MSAMRDVHDLVGAPVFCSWSGEGLRPSLARSDSGRGGAARPGGDDDRDGHPAALARAASVRAGGAGASGQDPGSLRLGHVGGYEAGFRRFVREAVAAAAKTGIFGDIDLAGHRGWVERVCPAAGVAACLPLWDRDRAAAMEQSVQDGFRAVIVAVRDGVLPTSLLGEVIDAAVRRRAIAETPGGALERGKSPFRRRGGGDGMTDGSVQAVVFDLGGVLIDWNPRYLYRRVFDSEGEMEGFLTTVCTPEWNAELDRGRSFEEMVALLCSEHPERREEIEAYHLRWDEMLGESFEGSVRILEELHSAGYPLYALTNWSAETFHIARKRYGFLSLFREIIVSGEAGLVKPDPKIYELLVERTGIDPSRAVFVDDREENVRAAEKQGFTGVLFQEPRQLRWDLTGLGLLAGHSAGPPRAEQQDQEDEVRAPPIRAGHDHGSREPVYEAVLFDLDGVVADTARSVEAFWQELADEHGFRITQEDFDRHVHGRPTNHTIEALFSMLDEKQKAQIPERAEEYERNLSYAEVPGAVYLLKQLAAHGIPAALATGAESWKVEEVSRQLGLAGAFAARVVGSDVENGKPSPECYLLAAERLGVGPERCMVFEDAVSGVEAAVAAGALCVGVGPRKAERPLTEAGAATIVRDLSEVRLDGAGARDKVSCLVHMEVGTSLDLLFTST